jgi:hypothetical protein
VKQLGIIRFERIPDVFHPVKMIQSDDKPALHDILQQFPQNFSGLGKLRNHQVKLNMDMSVKPVATPPRPVPYHLKERVARVIEEIVSQDVIEEHPSHETASRLKYECFASYRMHQILINGPKLQW